LSRGLRADPLSLVRDHRVKELLMAEGIAVQSFNADLLYEPWEVLDDDGCPFTMFAPFWNRCLCMPDPAAPLLPPKRINSGLQMHQLVTDIVALPGDQTLTLKCMFHR
jgi:deoxyribodipyrimidine photolyase